MPSELLTTGASGFIRRPCIPGNAVPRLPGKEMDTGSAREALGWRPRTPEEAIVSGARSLIDLGLVWRECTG